MDQKDKEFCINVKMLHDCKLLYNHLFLADLTDSIKMNEFTLQQTIFSGIKLTFTCSHSSARRASKSSCSKDTGQQDGRLGFTFTKNQS